MFRHKANILENHLFTWAACTEGPGRPFGPTIVGLFTYLCIYLFIYLLGSAELVESTHKGIFNV